MISFSMDSDTMRDEFKDLVVKIGMSIKKSFSRIANTPKELGVPINVLIKILTY